MTTDVTSFLDLIFMSTNIHEDATNFNNRMSDRSAITTTTTSTTTTAEPLPEHVSSFEIVIPTVFGIFLVLAFNLVVFYVRNDVAHQPNVNKTTHSDHTNKQM